MAENETNKGLLELDFVINDESVNRYGYRILTAGIRTGHFERNPVCCVQHDKYRISVGKWKNLRKENGEFKGTLEFDKEDADAVRLYKKYKNGYMNAVSISVLPVTESDKAEDLMAGQKYPTVVDSDLLEISLVTVPGQGNAVRLRYTDGSEYKLGLITSKEETMNKDKEETVASLQKELETQRKVNAENLINLFMERGVVQEAEKSILTELAFSDYERVSGLLQARRKETAADPSVTLATQLIELHMNRGVVTAGEKAFYTDCAKRDYEGTKKILEARTGKEGIQSFVGSLQNGAGGTSKENETWTFLDWYKKDMEGLTLMRKNEPEKYNRLMAELDKENKRLGVYTD